jgi:predicted MFS family arabinose efflux permease
MGIYTVFLDIALGLGSLVLGLVAEYAGVDAVFLAAALTVTSATIVALHLRRR